MLLPSMPTMRASMVTTSSSAAFSSTHSAVMILVVLAMGKTASAFDANSTRPVDCSTTIAACAETFSPAKVCSGNSIRAKISAHARHFFI